MLLTLITKEFINSVFVPDSPVGQYWLEKSDDSKNLWGIRVEGIDEDWILKCNPGVQIIDSYGNSVDLPKIEANEIYYISVDGSTKAYVFSESVTDDRKTFTKYLINDGATVLIGRGKNNDIVCSNSFISSKHAQLKFINGVWSIDDLGSSNGTFVNNKKIISQELSFGDVIFIMGIRIIVGSNFISINNPDESVKINSTEINEYCLQKSMELGAISGTKKIIFHRSPRIKKDYVRKKVKIDSPPSKKSPDEMPLIYTIGPSLTMGIASVVTAVFSVINAISQGNISSSIPTIVMALSMVLGCTLWPVISKKKDTKKRIADEAIRQEKYKKYLKDMDIMISGECRNEELVLRENNLLTKECVQKIKNVSNTLWERDSTQNDFLNIRLGTGSGELDMELSYQERGFSVDDDNLLDEMYEVCEEKRQLNDIPIVLSLFNCRFVGIAGDYYRRYEFFKGIVFQLAALYSYEEIKFVFLCCSDHATDFEFVKWIPHSWDDEKKTRFVAYDNTEIKELCSYFDRVIEKQKEKTRENEKKPYYIIFDMDKNLSDYFYPLKRIYQEKENLNFSVISFRDNFYDLSNECSTVVEIYGDRCSLMNNNSTDGERTEFTPDLYVFDDPVSLAKKLYGIKLKTSIEKENLPDTVKFLDMYGVRNVNHLNAPDLWKKNNPIKSLAVPIGLGTNGEPITLDLHEKFHGPHGLIAGMTGSGKSEFIISYILSLAISFRPDEVEFVLIDYKGGGMAKTFSNLPHTAGIITNLDGTSIKRSLISIESEIKRRQKIFSVAGEKNGTSNIDIYKYQQLYREKVVDEPLSHLFIISDEFAELKTQCPDFMDQLVSAARIGRSLGVHLILATQKPSGVVDDQIWSNSKFRVCLKVQDSADSMDMLKRPDAVSLTQMGRFYLQVGYNELFELGQSAWSGCDYTPDEDLKTPSCIEVIDNTGHVVSQIFQSNSSEKSSSGKQVNKIVEYLYKMASRESSFARKLWLPPIPSKIYVEDLVSKYDIRKKNSFELNPVVGEYDNPAKQLQGVLTLNLSDKGNAVIFGTVKSGKSTFLGTTVYSLITEHSPDEVNIYILDFASEMLKVFESAPQVGDVAFLNDFEKVTNCFKKLRKEISRRRTLFSDYGGSYSGYISKTGDKIPNIVLAINNVAAFYEAYEELEDSLVTVSREGSRYGIYVILTATNVTDLRFKVLQNFNQLISLQMNDESDYSSVVGRTNGLYPSKYPGRGLVKLGDDIFEFQTAYICDGDMQECVKDICDEQVGIYPGKKAAPIPLLPQVLDSSFLIASLNESNSRIPVGIEKESLNTSYYPLFEKTLNVVLSNEREYTGFLYGVAELVSHGKMAEVLVLDIRKCRNSTEINEIESTVKKISKLIEKKKTDKKILVVINSLSDLVSNISDSSAELLKRSIVHNEKGSNVYFLVGDQTRAYTTMTYDGFIPDTFDNTTGIWIGNGITDQFNIKWTKMIRSMNEDSSGGFGFVVINGNAEKVKLVNDLGEGI